MDEWTTSEYWQVVHDIAVEALEAEAAGQDIGDYIYESVDSSEFIIYGAGNAVVLAASTQDHGTLWKEADSFDQATTFVAFECMKADVWDEIQSIRKN